MYKKTLTLICVFALSGASLVVKADDGAKRLYAQAQKRQPVQRPAPKQRFVPDRQMDAKDRRTNVVQRANSIRVNNDFKRHCEANLSNNHLSAELITPKIEYNTNTSVDEISRIVGVGSHGQRALGITKSRMNVGATYKPQIYTDNATGVSCMRFQANIELKLTQQIYVGREFNNHKCVFDDILNHEHKHASANHRQLQDVKSYALKVLAQRYGNKVFYGEQEQLLAQLKNEMNTFFLDGLHAKYDEVQAIHRQIDSDDEYARSGEICNQAVPKILLAKKSQDIHAKR